MKRPKQVLIVRKDLCMTKGKMIAQACHASMKVFLDFGFWRLLLLMLSIAFDFGANPITKWLKGSFAKICVYCESEEELEQLYQKALDAKLPCAIIVDSGRTMFKGVPTKTVVAIGPWHPEEIDKITSHLKLL